MKVYIFSIVPSPYQRDLFRAMAKRVDITVFYMENESPDSPWPRKQLEAFESVLPGKFVSLKGMRFFINWQMPAVDAADVVILNGYMGNVFQWLLRFKSKSNRFIFWGERMSDQRPSVKSKIHWWLTEPLKNCRAIAAIGKRAQTEYSMRFKSLPVFNVPYFCDLTLFQKLPLKTGRKKINFLFCGQMIYRKGLDVLLTAFDSLASQYDMLLHLVGREAELNEMLSALSQESKKKIIYHGFQPPEKLAGFFDQVDVFILPSRYDGWGVVVNQALGAGLPIVCSDEVGAGLDLIEEGKNGFRFRSESVEDLCSKLKTLIDQPKLISSMSASSREKSFQMSTEKGVEKWIGVLNEVMAKG